jgi:WD40 repeat protein
MLLGTYQSNGYITSVAFSPDGNEMLASSWRSPVRAWSTQPPFSNERVFPGHSETVWSAAFHPDGQRIASASGAIQLNSSDNSIRIWEASTTRQVQRLEGQVSTVNSVNFDNTGRFMLSGHQDRTFKLWDLREGGAPRVSQLEDEVETASFTPDQRSVLVATSNGEIQLRQLNVADPPRTIKGYAPAQFTPDGRFVLSVTSAGPNLKGHRAAIQQSDPFSGREPQTFEGSHGDLITSIAVSPDGHQVVTGSWDRTLRLWNIAKKRSVATFEGHTDRVYAVAFSPDGTRIVSASGDSTLRIWNVATQKTTRILKGHELWVTSVAFSPDGRFILSGGADKTVRV